MRAARAWAWAWTGWAMAATVMGCASVPDYRYHTLDMRSQADLGAPVWLEEVRPRLNEALTRPEIMIRVSPTQVEYYALDRWASRLDEQLAEKLKTEFAPADDARFQATVDGTVMAFEQVDTPGGADARLKAELRVRMLQRGALVAEFTRLYDIQEPAQAARPDAVVAALSRAVETLAARLSEDMRQAVSQTP